MLIRRKASNGDVYLVPPLITLTGRVGGMGWVFY
jgi:hypothetical protein